MSTNSIGGQGSVGSMASMASDLNRQTFGAQVVAKTLDTLNQSHAGVGGGTNADYDFQTKVLSAAFSGKGGIADENI
jgi:hypothetical protein